MGFLIASAAAFVLSHFLLSHVLRAALVARWGEQRFLGFYSGVALATFGAMAVGFVLAEDGRAYWGVGDFLWGFATLVMLIASILLMGSLLGNPALPGAADDARTPPEPNGVFTITRHPMMWAFALWSVAHVLIFPVDRNLVVTSAILVLALGGAALQDGKKAKLHPEFWRLWEARTSYWPFAAVAAGRTRFRIGARGAMAIVLGTAFWLAATWLHLPISGWAAGIWRWVEL